MRSLAMLIAHVSSLFRTVLAAQSDLGRQWPGKPDAAPAPTPRPARPVTGAILFRISYRQRPKAARANTRPDQSEVDCPGRRAAGSRPPACHVRSGSVPQPSRPVSEPTGTTRIISRIPTRPTPSPPGNTNLHPNGRIRPHTPRSTRPPGSPNRSGTDHGVVTSGFARSGRVDRSAAEVRPWWCCRVRPNRAGGGQRGTARQHPGCCRSARSWWPRQPGRVCPTSAR
jgi:hypothetical protein